MLFGSLLKKYSETRAKRALLWNLIEWLSIDKVQKELFQNSLEFLDKDGLSSLYAKITQFVIEVEDRRALERFKKTDTSIRKIKDFETKDKEKERNSFNILLDSI